MPLNSIGLLAPLLRHDRRSLSLLLSFQDAFIASNVLDSVLFRDAFGTPAMRAVFDDHELIRKYVIVEIALAKAQARCGVIPEAAAQEIALRCNADTLDFDLLRHETEIVGYPILPLVHQISKQAGQSGGFVHWGDFVE